jgi:uncharacterized lipoprotein YmbA
MTRRVAQAWGVALVAIAAVGAGCSTIHESAPQRYWTLTAIAGDVAEAPLERTIGVGPVSLPGYLDRVGVVTRTGSRLEVAQFDVWGQPLAENVTRVLADNLERLLPGTSAAPFPWEDVSSRLDQRVAVRIARFEADGDGTVHLEASWSVRSADRSEPRSGGRAAIREPVAGGDDVEQISEAMSRSLAELSRRIAAQLSARSGP